MADSSQVNALANTMNPTGNQALVTPGGTTTATQTDPSAAFMSQLQTQLQQAQGAVSSSDGTISDQIQKAIDSQKTSATDNASALNLQYGAKEAIQATTNKNNLTSAQDAQRGFATNNALLGQIQKTGTDAINDLETQKNMLIQSGNAAAAAKIGDLQVQQAQMTLQNRQQVFQNLVSLAGVANQAGQLAISQQQLKLQQDQSLTDLQSKMGTIALNYGIKVNAGDTLPDVVNRASTNAKALYDYSLQDAAASLKLKAAQTTLANAQAAAAGQKDAPIDFNPLWSAMQMVGGASSAQGKQMVSTVATSLANNPQALTTFFNGLTKTQQPKVQPKTDLLQGALFAKSQGQDYQTYVGSLTLNSSIQNKQDAIDIAQNVYNQRDLPGMLGLYAQDFAQTYGASAFKPFGITGVGGK